MEYREAMHWKNARTIANVAFAVFLTIPAVASATGTARIQQADGNVKVYKNVHIAIEHKQMLLTSADGVGTFVISRAACAAVDKLVRCYPYDAVLKQRGMTLPITIVDGTAWLNPGTTKAHLPNSTTQLDPHGLMMSFRTKRGSYVSLTGVVDVLKK